MEKGTTMEDQDFVQHLYDMKSKCAFMMEVAYIQFYNEKEGERLLSDEGSIGFDLISDVLKNEFDGLIEQAKAFK